MSAGVGAPPVIAHGTPGLSTSGVCALKIMPVTPVNASEMTTSAATAPVVNDQKGPAVAPPGPRATTCHIYVVATLSAGV